MYISYRSLNCIRERRGGDRRFFYLETAISTDTMEHRIFNGRIGIRNEARDNGFYLDPLFSSNLALI